MILFLIRAYRALPGFMKRSCPRPGLSCSQLAYRAVSNGAGLVVVLAVIGSCAECNPNRYPRVPMPGKGGSGAG